jgi:hypothetical protein
MVDAKLSPPAKALPRYYRCREKCVAKAAVPIELVTVTVAT